MSQVHPTATGGFVARAERPLLEFASPTSATVGPGSYLADWGPEPVPCAAPFYVSTARALMENTTTSAITPGPGAYSPPVNQSVAGRTVQAPTTGPFASGTARLYEDKTRRHVPGPGAYPDDNGWVRKSFHAHPSAEGRHSRVVYDRSNTAPSIPAPHQSFGYEEDNTSGKLVLQPAPMTVYAGVGFDKVGPGRYEPTVDPVLPNGKATTWSHSKTQRGKNFKNNIPGVGAYDVTKGGSTGAAGTNSMTTITVNGMELVLGGTGGSSSFATKVPRPHQAPHADAQGTPGPGAYLGTIAQKQTAAPKFQFFGSTSRRAGEVDPTASKHVPTFWHSPGPGAYDDLRMSVPAKPRAIYEPTPFSSTTARFVGPDPIAPGPNSYRPEDYTAVSTEISRKAEVGRNGIFSSSAPRFKEEGASSSLNGAAAIIASITGRDPPASPGPGHYNAALPPGLRVPRGKGGHSEFASKTARFLPASAPPSHPSLRDYDPVTAAGEPPKGDLSRRGPGEYHHAENWTKSRVSHKSTPFGIQEKKFDAISPSPKKVTPGPGTYTDGADMHDAFKPFTNTDPGVGFGAAVARFKHHPKATPGPGYYESPGTLNKTSFNVTYEVPAQ